METRAIIFRARQLEPQVERYDVSQFLKVYGHLREIHL